jgi:bifunctional lysine-specific demethylase and histidyl-hydroxylase NO66
VHPPDEERPWDLTLRPGDVLYLPAGTRHAAQTIDEPSLHLTVGVRTVRWADLVRRALDGLLDGDELAAPLPAGWADDPSMLAGELQARFGGLTGPLDVGAAARVCAAEAAAFRSSRTPDLTGGLRDLLELEQLDAASVLRRRPGTVCRIEAGEQHLELVLGDRRLRMPVALRPALERIVARDRFRPADLEDLLDAGSQLVLCRRLVREGLLTFDRAGGLTSDG